MGNPTLLTASQAAKAISDGRITSRQLLDNLLDRIEKINPQLNAIVTIDIPGARAKAQQADLALERGECWGPLHGVPVTIKDSFETAGMRTVSGYPPFAKRIPQEDAPPVARLRKAGAIILGKTNLPTLASGIQTYNPVFGRTNNPWDLARTPGGSSGGAAAAISSGISFLELGSDIGGSIRIPAHFCGVYGLKCSGGRVSGKGHLASPKPLSVPGGWEALLQLGSMGPLARSIEDLRLAFPILAEPGTPGLDPQPEKPLPELRIAWTEDFGGAPLDSASRKIMQTLADRLKRAGCQLEQSPDFDYEEAWYIAGACLGAINTLFQSPLTQRLRRIAAPFLVRASQSQAIQRGLYTGVSLQPRKIQEILGQRQALVERCESFLDQWDAWICPVFPTPAFTHCKPNDPIEIDGNPYSQMLANLQHSILFNVTGLPVVTIPIGLTEQGLPVGIQLIGKKWQEMKLLNVAAAVAIQTSGFLEPPLNA